MDIGPTSILCENGHPVIAGRFCSECGAPAVLPAVSDDTLLMCPQGHAVAPGMAFCEECGSATVATESLTAAATDPGQEPTSDARDSGRNHGKASGSGVPTKPLAIVGGVILLVIIGLLVMTTRGSGIKSAPRPADASPQESNHQICVDQLASAMISINSMNEYGPNGSNDDLAFGGESDPFHQKAAELVAKQTSDYQKYGQATAAKNLDGVLDEWCTSNGDPMRFNANSGGDLLGN